MDQCEEDSEVLQLNEEEQWPSDRSVPPTGSTDQAEDKEQPTQGQEDDGGDEWDTDLETDDTKQEQSRAERYLKACRKLGIAPISSFLRNSSEANVNLNHYGVGPLGAKALAKALQFDRVVTNLELEDNALRAEGARYLAEMFQTNISIHSLNLSNNQLHHDGADIVFKMLLDNCFVKSIKLSGNGFVDTAAKYFAEALKDDHLVTELDLSDNKFCESGGEHLGHMLAKNTCIKVLNLSWNSLCTRGVVALSAGLKLNSTLEQLQLSWNRLGHVEAESLAQALKQNKKLELLDLSGNVIDNKAVTLLCQGLANNGSLRVLRLSHNPLTNDGALTLLKTVTDNKKSAVEELDISTVFVYEAFVELLEEARQSRPALDVRYSIMSDTERNLSALRIFKKFLNERNESIMDFCQALDKDGTMTVSTSDFRKAVKEANVPLNHGQLEWLIKKFDKNCTATINYSSSFNPILSSVNT
ncbi:uncharacterized protein [Pagrus major]|uniref:uncharacterized protein n=1 Tax=Pagrus major TaxID=143350 RepID=UPI003CC8C1E3